MALAFATKTKSKASVEEAASHRPTTKHRSGGRRAELPLYLRAHFTSDAPQQSAGRDTASPSRIDFPHASRIHHAFGMPIPGSAMLDPAECDRRGVVAFTDRDVTHFASASPDLRVAAHEAAHQMQHTGATRDAGLGAEGHAHAVARVVLGGGSAGALMGSRGAAVTGRVHNYTEYTADEQQAQNQWKAGGTVKVADDGRAVTTGNKHECYADAGLIAEASKILSAKQSGVELSAGGGGISGEAPDGSGWKSLTRVKAKIVSSDVLWGEDELWADCGRSSREVQGPTGADKAPSGVYNDPATGKRVETSASKDPLVYRDDIYVAAGLGPTPEEARKAYLAMSEDERKKFDEKYGLNKYAAPQVGEAFVARSDPELRKKGFNWHWGTVVMVTSTDRVTLENYTKTKKGDYKAKDADWFFAMYGPPSKPGQTFHERYENAVGGKDANTTTMVARTSPDPSTDLKSAARLTTPELIDRYDSATRQEEQMALMAEMKTRNLWVSVTVNSTEDWAGADSVYVTASAGGKRGKSFVYDLNDGQSFDFFVSLASLAPIAGKGPITIRVYDEDWEGDDVIVHMTWSSPFTPITNSSSMDEANYSVKAYFIW